LADVTIRLQPVQLETLTVRDDGPVLSADIDAPAAPS
jgi:hypothetical protein